MYNESLNGLKVNNLDFKVTGANKIQDIFVGEYV